MTMWRGLKYIIISLPFSDPISEVTNSITPGEYDYTSMVTTVRPPTDE